jgi:hypothetical protein
MTYDKWTVTVLLKTGGGYSGWCESKLVAHAVVTDLKRRNPSASVTLRNDLFVNETTMMQLPHLK